MEQLRDILRSRFGLDDFRPGQQEVIKDVLAGHDVLCVMPTGAGKSLCYQLPAVLKGGLVIVVSPLISLMADQVRQLRALGIPAAYLNSTLAAADRRQIMSELSQGFEGLLYVAPERFFAGDFAELLPHLKPGLFVIDEAHCISQWGHDFRPEYSKLAQVRKDMGDPLTIALTATATAEVRIDIVLQGGLHDPHVHITGFDRPNLQYECLHLHSEHDKMDHLVAAIKSNQESGIIYCATRKNVEELSGTLAMYLKDKVVVGYHAGMTNIERGRAQEVFMNTRGAVCVATNAFGMGINKPDTRFVIHYNIPGTLEAYYQEAGRAGRDGKPSRCTLLFSFQDVKIQEFFIGLIGKESPRDNNPEFQGPARPRPKLSEATIELMKQRATRMLQNIKGYAEALVCRRKMILDYFGDHATVRDCHCDVCLAGSSRFEEIVALTKKMLSAVARMQGKFGLGAVAEVLVGQNSERVERWKLNELTVYGLLEGWDLNRVMMMLHRLVEAGLAKREDETGGDKPLMSITQHGVMVMKGELAPPMALMGLVGQKGDGSSKGKKKKAKKVEGEAALDEAAEARFQLLRQWRSGVAKRLDIPAFTVLGDKTLRSIAREMPEKTDDLRGISGMGPKKMELYAQDIITVLRPN